MSAHYIRFENETGLFSFNGQSQYDGQIKFRDGAACVSPSEVDDGIALTHAVIGQIIGQALGYGEYVQFSGCCVSVNYLVQMLRYTRKNGKFWDLLQNTADHDFDSNRPTPGGYVGEIGTLRAQIKELQTYANGARMAHMSDEVAKTEETIKDLRQRIRTLSSL
jgi:hypothetical protein